MIDAKSLRIGNYFYDRGGKILKLEFWDGPGKMAQNNVIGGITFHPLTEYTEHANPIPLSGDILIKAGFTKASASPDSVFSINYDGKALIGYWLDGVVNVGEFAPKNIKYLHEIQNLYYALTGTELTINL